MKVRDILALKGNALYTITPEDSLADAAAVMAQKDIGSLVVMSHERVVGILTFREVIEATVRTTGQTGVEMEALTAVGVAALTVYDMVKAVDRGMEIVCTRLLKKSGGKSGLFERESSICGPNG